MILQLIILTTLWRASDAIIGYDCGLTALNTTTISTIGVEDCDVPTTIEKTEKMKGVVMQSIDYGKTEVMQCKVKVIKNAFNCGTMTDYVSAMPGGLAEFVLDVGESACHEAHTNKRITILGLTFNDLKMNTTNYRRGTLAGSLNLDEDCRGAQYSDAYADYENVVVQATIKI